ncbi:MAG: pseudouridine-5'-phosphate glycosidase, partial [Chloroflexota bacterium]
MTNQFPPAFMIDPEVGAALAAGEPVVALESTVITHGLPYPENLALAEEMQSVIRAQGAVPATIAVIDGVVRVGLDQSALERLAQAKDVRKISVRDYAPALAQKATGGTTVAGTLLAAEQVGIRIFATGGIGGVHRDAP